MRLEKKFYQEQMKGKPRITEQQVYERPDDNDVNHTLTCHHPDSK